MTRKQVVKVKFLDKQRLKPIGNAYTYFDGTDGLNLGDIVRVGRGRAMVVEVNVPYEEIQVWDELGTAKSITEVVTDEGSVRKDCSTTGSKYLSQTLE